MSETSSCETCHWYDEDVNCLNINMFMKSHESGNCEYYKKAEVVNICDQERILEAINSINGIK